MSWPLVVSAACLVFCACAFLYFRSYIRRHTGTDAMLGEVREAVRLLLLQIDETAERDISLLEDREKSLRALLEDCDRRLMAYGRELDRQRGAEKARQDLAEQARALEKAALRAVVEEPPARSAEPAPPAPPAERPARDQIRDLARAGISPRVIASRLGISVSEAELAVAILERGS